MQRDLTILSNVRLESFRREELAEQRYYKPESRYFKLNQKRIDRIDVEILRRAESFIGWLTEQVNDRERRGDKEAAQAWESRIAQVRAMQVQAKAEKKEAELQTEPVLRAWELQIVYGDDAPMVMAGNEMTKQAEQNTESNLRLIESEEPAIAAARKLVASGQATGRMDYDLRTYDQMHRIITQAAAEGRTVGQTIHTYRASALADLRRAFAQNAAETVRWSNLDYTQEAKAAGGVLVMKMEAA